MGDDVRSSPLLTALATEPLATSLPGERAFVTLDAKDAELSLASDSTFRPPGEAGPEDSAELQAATLRLEPLALAAAPSASLRAKAASPHAKGKVQRATVIGGTSRGGKRGTPASVLRAEKAAAEDEAFAESFMNGTQREALDVLKAAALGNTAALPLDLTGVGASAAEDKGVDTPITAAIASCDPSLATATATWTASQATLAEESQSLCGTSTLVPAPREAQLPASLSEQFYDDEDFEQELKMSEELHAAACEEDDGVSQEAVTSTPQVAIAHKNATLDLVSPRSALSPCGSTLDYSATIGSSLALTGSFLGASLAPPAAVSTRGGLGTSCGTFGNLGLTKVLDNALEGTLGDTLELSGTSLGGTALSAAALGGGGALDDEKARSEASVSTAATSGGTPVSVSQRQLEVFASAISGANGLGEELQGDLLQLIKSLPIAAK